MYLSVFHILKINGIRGVASIGPGEAMVRPIMANEVGNMVLYCDNHVDSFLWFDFHLFQWPCPRPCSVSFILDTCVNIAYIAVLPRTHHSLFFM